MISGGGYQPAASVHLLTFGDDPPRLRGGERLALNVKRFCRIVQGPDVRRARRVQTAAYYYTVDDADGREVLGYHWHPDDRNLARQPHLHLDPGAQMGHRALAAAHLLTGRVTLPEILRLAIADLGVLPIRADWSAVSNAAQAALAE